jgi:precorrin-6B methylase 2
VSSTLPATEPSPVRVPPPGPDAVYCTLYSRDPGFSDLAQAELAALAGGHGAESGVWLTDRPVAWAQTGYGKDGGRQLAFATTLEDLEAQLLALELVAPRIGITVRRVPRRASGTQAAKKCVADCIDGDVDFEDPQLRLILVVSALGFRVLLRTEPGDPGWLASSHKPHNYLVALPVRIAKAMLNLTAQAGDVVFDPFCGSGTIPLLAAWANHEAYGSDISWKCVTRARENIAHFGKTAPLTRADAKDAEQAADCIISNLPYNLYCSIGDETLQAVLANLRGLASRVTLVSSERLDEALEANGYELLQRICVESDRFERTIYVTRVKP